MEEFEKYNNEELVEALIDETIKYYTITKSEVIAKQLLKENKQEYFDANQNFKRRYYLFRKYVKLHGIVVLQQLKNVEIVREDVLERLYESEATHIALIYRHANNYYGYLGNGVYDNDNNVFFDENTGANIRVKEIEDVYEEIINNYEMEKHLTK